jgi:putative DNA primase/helicase
MKARFDVSKTRGRWKSLLMELGVPAETVSGRNKPCPFCGGKDRFRFTDFEGMGVWVCNVCGSGNGMTFVQKWCDCDFVAAIHHVEKILPKSKVLGGGRTPNPGRSKKLWAEATPVVIDDPVGIYLLERGVWCDDVSRELRCSRETVYFEGVEKVGLYDAMLARVIDGNNVATTIHCTYLEDAKKADVGSPKKVMSAMGSGAAIRLYPSGDLLALTEGIETALAVHQHTAYPVWACVSATGLQGASVPDSVKELLIYSDNDDNFVGQSAAYALAKRMRAAGKRVTVFTPNVVGLDFADADAWEDEYTGKL